MKIGFIGLGIMGESMCENIVKKHDDTVYCFDFVSEKISKLEGVGAKGAASNLDLAQKSDVIISMVPKSEHSMSVYKEILPALDSSKICIDMSTIDPSVSVEISEMVKKTGAQFADAPVVKSKPAAIAGKLGIYVGCEEELFPKIRPILSYMGENIIRLGENGRGLVMKICHNALVSQIQNGVNETSLLAAANGIDIETFATAISYGGAGNFYLDSKKDNIARGDFTTAFSIENENKDVHICKALADQCHLRLPGEENAVRVYEKAMDMGLGKEDFSATIKVVRSISEDR
ncbi:MAG: NAD(P)-dependent oxidoreductase [Candidatus Weimeria sp.]